MRERFKDIRFNRESRQLIDTCNDIIENYVAAGMRLTLRQLYYQLVSTNVIPNEEKSYKNLGALVSKARLAGELDWDAIEDRVRQARKPAEFASLNDLVEAALYAFRLPRHQGQTTYTEVWVEKDSLASVLEPITERYHVTLMVNRGYSSQSAMYESAQRIRDRCEQYEADDAVVLYFGDLDPSGEDMVRDIDDRLSMFGTDVTVKKIALTFEQQQQYNLPPNPAKLTDTRARAFIAKYGRESWELDAIPPRELQRLVTEALEQHLDMARIGQYVAKERELKDQLRIAMRDIG